MTKKKFVKVTWHDAQDAPDTWVHQDDVQHFTDSLCEVTSWGWIVGQSKHYLTLAADYVKDGDYGRVTKIPRGMIVKTEEFQDE